MSLRELKNKLKRRLRNGKAAGQSNPSGSTTPFSSDSVSNNVEGTPALTESIAIVDCPPVPLVNIATDVKTRPASQSEAGEDLLSKPLNLEDVECEESSPVSSRVLNTSIITPNISDAVHRPIMHTEEIGNAGQSISKPSEDLWARAFQSFSKEHTKLAQRYLHVRFITKEGYQRLT